MGTWITHLRVAENLLPHLAGVDEVAFVYGNLAPDSGLPNADWTVFDPPKEVTHFLHTGEGESAIRDYLFYQQYLAPIRSGWEAGVYGFRLGYFVHLICDSLWSRKIGAATARAFAAEIQADKRKAWDNIKRDWYGLDQIYVQEQRTSLFWRVIAATSNPPSQLPFISDVAMHRQLDYIRNFYSFPGPEWITPRAYPYLNAPTLAQMVADSTATVLYLWGNRQRFDEVAGTGTTLSLISDHDLSPYAMPLGDRRE